jgi:hypothetical protein
MTQGTQFFTSSTTNALLRRTVDERGLFDEVFVKGKWKHTDTIAEYMIGEENNVSAITETQARRLKPAAFN